MAADGFAQRGLRAHGDGLDEILNFQDRFFGVPDHPENDGIDIDRNGVAGERGFGGYAGGADALVHEAAEGIEDGEHMEPAGPAQAHVAAKAQNGHLFPLVRHLDEEQQIETKKCAGDQRNTGIHEDGGQETCPERYDKECDGDAA